MQRKEQMGEKCMSDFTRDTEEEQSRLCDVQWPKNLIRDEEINNRIRKEG